MHLVCNMCPGVTFNERAELGGQRPGSRLESTAVTRACAVQAKYASDSLIQQQEEAKSLLNLHT